MKKTFKKALAVLLVAVMVFGAAPLAGFVGIELPEFNLFGTKAEAAASGYFTYSVSNNRATITDVSTSISGSVTIPATLGGYPVTSIGAYAFCNCTGLTNVTIPDSVTSIGYSAFNSCNSLKSVSIGKSVRSIGEAAFYGCTGLTSITIPDSVKSIGIEVFRSCTGLTSVTIGNGVTSIGDGAFYNCTGLTSITIGNGVTSIGSRAFSDCTGLTSITIPNSVTSIGDNAFSYCTLLTSITVDVNNPNYSSDEYGVLFNKDKSKLIQYPIGNKRTEYIIPDSVTSIGEAAFEYCTGLTSVTIGNGVTSIGNSAFSGCDGLTSITVDVNNPNYSSDEYGVLFNKDKTELIQYPAGNERISYTIPDSVTSIGYYAFFYCAKLTSVRVGNSVTSIGTGAFSYCTRLTRVTIPDSVTSIGDRAFSSCTGLTSVTIPDSVTSIGEYAFSGCDGLTSVTIGNGVTSIGSYAFDDCAGLTSVTIGNGVTSIGGGAFYYCTGLTSVTIPNSVTSIGGGAFYYCTGLTSVTIGNGVTSIGSSAFENCTGLTSVTIPDSVTSIGGYAFYNCDGLTSITIPDSVTSIGDCAFEGCTGLTRVTIGNGVTSIGYDAFRGCTRLTSVTIGNGVTSIGWNAFDGCNNLSTTYYVGTPEQWRDIWIGSFNDPINRNIIFECNSERPNYGKGACGDNLSWTLYTDGELVIDGTGDMKDYSSDSNVPWNSKRSIIKSATIPDSVTSIGKYAFKGCTGLTSVTIPDGVTSIGDYAFDGCNNLSTTYYVGTPEQWRDISISHSNDPIKKNIIFECNSERPYYQGTCGENLTWTLYTDGELVIDGTGNMTDYSTASKAPWYARRSKIESATIGNGVTSIGDYALYECEGLTSVTISDSVTSIGDYAFYGCTNLEKIEISAYSVEFADNSFDNSPKVILYCKSGSTVQSYAELNDIMYILIDGPASGFAVKNNQLVAYKGESENPQIPSGVTSIGSNAFKDNSTVKTVELPNSVSSIFSGAFSNCSSLERIVVPHTVTTIAPDAFNGTNTTIVCYANSYAHQYAVEKGMNFELISVKLNQTKVILSVGEYSIITATPEQEYLDSVQTSWKSSDTGVATVDANGKVTALSNGTATIYALAPTGETLATCSVQVGYSFRITIQNPSTKTISYKSGIILHATADNLPAGAKIVWEKDNDNFSMSDDGNGNCKIISKANGSTTFTAKVKLADGSIAKDSNGNEISAQVTMNSKAGFFDKIVAFFKGLFGGNKVLPQLFKGIF